MKTFAHPIMLEDADLDYVTGGGISLNNSANSPVSRNQFSGDVNSSNSFNDTNSGNTTPGDDHDKPA